MSEHFQDPTDDRIGEDKFEDEELLGNPETEQTLVEASPREGIYEELQVEYQENETEFNLSSFNITLEDVDIEFVDELPNMDLVEVDSTFNPDRFQPITNNSEELVYPNAVEDTSDAQINTLDHLMVENEVGKFDPELSEKLDPDIIEISEPSNLFELENQLDNQQHFPETVEGPIHGNENFLEPDILETGNYIESEYITEKDDLIDEELEIISDEFDTQLPFEEESNHSDTQEKHAQESTEVISLRHENHLIDSPAEEAELVENESLIEEFLIENDEDALEDKFQSSTGLEEEQGRHEREWRAELEESERQTPSHHSDYIIATEEEETDEEVDEDNDEDIEEEIDESEEDEDEKDTQGLDKFFDPIPYQGSMKSPQKRSIDTANLHPIFGVISRQKGSYFGPPADSEYLGKTSKQEGYLGPPVDNPYFNKPTTIEKVKVQEEQKMDPILLRDEKLANIKGDILTLEELREITKYPDQKIRIVYKSELLHQLNELLQENSVNDAAKIIGYTPDNTSKMKTQYHLPNKHLGEFIDDINVKDVASEINESEQWVRNIYKVSILKKLNRILNIKADIKAAARETGISYGVARKLVMQYKLPFNKDTAPSEKYSNEGEVGESKIKHHASKQRTVLIGGNTRLTTKAHGVMFARDLVGKSEEELKEMGPFIAINDQNQQVSCDILSARVIVGRAVHIKTKLGADLIVGVDTKIISDEPDGLKKIAAKDAAGKRIMTVKSLENLSDTDFNFFDLLEGDIPITFILHRKVAKAIINKLQIKYGTLKKACQKLGIHYRKVTERRFYREFLVKIYNDIGYPDIKSKDFFKMVEKIGIGGKKAFVNNIQVDDELLYLAGLIGSDGHVLKDITRKSTLGFSNTKMELINEYWKVLRKNFPKRHIVNKDPKGRKTTVEAITYNFPVVQFINNIGVKGRTVGDEKGYLPIFKLSKEKIAAFLRGMLDGDGTVDLGKQSISIAVFDPDRVKNVQLLLMRLGIDSNIKESEEWVTPPFAEEKILSIRHIVEIAGQKDMKKFIKKIGSRHPEKKMKFDIMMEQFESKNMLTSKYNYAPQVTIDLIRNIREKLGISLKKSGYRNIIWALENNKARTSIEKVKEILDAMGKLNADLFILPEYKEILPFLTSDYNLDIMEENEILEDVELIEIITNNRLIVDNGLVIDN